MKVCKTCNKELSNEEFYKHKFNLDGLYGSCKECTLRKQKKYYTEFLCTPKARQKQKERRNKK